MRGLHALWLSALLGCAAGAAAAGDAAALAVDRDTVLLVIAPHPDDETLCCAGVMQRVLSAGGHVSVLWLTSGDGSELGSLLIEKSLFANPEKMRSYGAQRMQEARQATAILGVPAAGQLFLGYPDGGMLRLLTQNQAAAYTSRFTGAAAVPYADAMFPGHAYTGARLRRILPPRWHRQTYLILAPSPLDSHPTTAPRTADDRGHRGCGTAGALLDRARRRGLAEAAGAARGPTADTRAARRAPRAAPVHTHTDGGGRKARRAQGLPHPDAPHGHVPAVLRAHHRALLPARYP
jgi:hypothetical protein